eukprot:722396_1
MARAESHWILLIGESVIYKQEQKLRQEINKIIETYGVKYGVTMRSRFKKKARVLKDHHPVFQSVPIMDIERCIQIMAMSHNRENNTFTDSFTTETPQ